MKPFSYTCALLFSLFVLTLNAQAPNRFNYQAVARYNNNEAITGSILVRLTILDGGSEVYKELHDNIIANEYGLFNLQIGSGILLGGNFDNIDWENGSGKFLKVEINAGDGYVDMGSQELVSVPYSLQSRNTAQLQGNPVSATLPSDGQVLMWDAVAGKWRPGDAGQPVVYSAGAGISINGNNQISNTAPDQAVSIIGAGATTVNGSYPNFSINTPFPADNSPTNEIQTLSLSGITLSLSNGGGSVLLPTGTTYTAGSGININGNVISNSGDGDSNPSNEIQNLSLAGNMISISNGNAVTLPAEVDGSVTNELQTLSLADADLTLSNGGGTVTLPTGTTYTEGNGIDINGNVISNSGDLSNTNEIQALSLSGTSLSLSNGGGTVTLPAEVDGSVTNELQTLSLAGADLTLSNGGGTVTLPTGTTYTEGNGIDINGNVISNSGDLSNTNEIQALSLSGTSLSLSNGGGTVTLPAEVDGSVSNELQTLSLTGADLTLSNGGGTVTLPAGTTYNAGNGIYFSGTTINAFDASPVNEIQTLSLSGALLSLTSGGTVTLPDASPTNEIQELSIDGNILLLSNGGGVVELPIYTTAGGDLNGSYPNPVVDGIQGKAVSSTAPQNGQVLQWNNTAWTPTTLPTASPGWLLTGNAGTNPSINFIGTTDNQPLVFKVNNLMAGKIASTGGNVFMGLDAGHSNTSGIDNSAFGYRALNNNTSGSYNTAAGIHALYSNTSGLANTGIGSNALYSNTTGQHNTALGNEALNANTTGGYNTAAGKNALHNNTSGLANTGIGSNALYSNTTGQYNTALGDAALNVNTIGGYNTATGRDALHNNTTGGQNTGTGHEALRSNTTGVNNTGLGAGALYANTTAGANTATGYLALGQSNGAGNTATGANALHSNSTGQSNSALGNSALFSTTTGSNTTGLGSNVDVSTGNLSNATVIGSGATVNASNKVVIGNSGVTVIGGYANWSNLSDGRFKENVQETVPGLSFITRLTPVTYTVNTRKLDEHVMQMMPDSIRARRLQSPEEYALAQTVVHTGFIAQDVERTAREIGYSFDGINAPANPTDTYSLAYGQFVAPLVRAVQEQQAMIEEQGKEIAQLKTELAEIKALLKERN